jgi:hypothetical protein
MDSKRNDTVILYVSQADAVWEAIQRDGIAVSRAEYVQKKYQESAPVFLTAYRWFVSRLPRYVPRPEGAEFPYWAFGDLYLMETGYSSHVLQLEVPVDEAVFFDMMDWNKIVQMRLLGETAAEEQAFHQELKARGVDYAEVMLSSFYPDLKMQIQFSWDRLFRHHQAARQGQFPVEKLQAGLWCIKKEWVRQHNGQPV